MSETIENTNLSLSFSTGGAESPKAMTLDEDSSSDSDPNISRSSFSLRSEDASDVSKDSANPKKGSPTQFTTITGFKINPRPVMVDDSGGIATETVGPMEVNDLHIDVASDRLSQMQSLKLLPRTSTKAVEERMAESRRLYWSTDTKEAVLKVG